MRWVRAHLQLGSRLALFALAIQLVLTFGHVHGISAGAAESALSALIHQVGNSAANSTSPGNSSGKASDYDCPICALIQLASTSAVSAPPALPIPAAFAILRPQAPQQLEWTASPHIPFQARGPPSI